MRLALTPAQQAYRRQVGRFAQSEVGPAAAAIDANNRFPVDLIRRAASEGLMGITVSGDHGGAGRDYVSYALAVTEVAKESAAVGAIVAVNNSFAEVVQHFGSSAQRSSWVSRLASGAAVGAFALSEEDAGTDAANLQTTATPDDAAYRLSGRKVWVANAEAADVLIVFAATTPGIGGRGVSAFLVPSDAPGVTRTEPYDSWGVRGLGAADVIFDDVRIDAAGRIGEEGEGFRVAMWALDGGRIAVGAQAVGIGQRALAEALRHADRRMTFGRPIAEYQAVQWMLADMATELDAADLLVLKAAAARDQQEQCTMEAAMAKLAASEASHRATDKAMQILASAAYRRGSIVERLVRDARATEIYPGTSEVQRMIIASKILES